MNDFVYASSRICDEHYSEPHRRYHNLIHISSMFTNLIANYSNLNELSKNYIHAAISFHDVIYDPTRTDNEERSIQFMKNEFKDYVDQNIIENILTPLIYYTKPSTYSDDLTHHSLRNLIKVMRELDLWDMLKGNDTGRSIYNNSLILKEYQFVPWGKLIANRIDFLKNLNVFDVEIDKELINIIIGYLMRYKPKIGIYAGSFNPFHIGHMNVLEQADNYFDQIIIATPKNSCDIEMLKMFLPTYQIIEFEGSLPDLMLDYRCKDGGDVMLIRGLRDQNDLIYEKNLAKIYKDMGMKNNIMYLMTEYPHVSSTVIRSMIKDNIDWSIYKPNKFSYLN